MLAVIIVENRKDKLQLIKDNHFAYLPVNSTLYINDKINSIVEYNQLLTSKAFWNNITEEHVLIIQHDSALLRKGLDEFAQYDYIGAPWKFEPYVGNGGLSMRKKSAMLKILDEVPYNGTDNEDIYFTWGCRKLGLNLAPYEVAEKFSCETIFKLGTIGYHAIEKYLTEDECKQIKEQYAVK